MSLWFKFHKPGFVDDSSPPNEWIEYTNQVDLLMHPTLVRWSKNPGFVGFAQDRDAGCGMRDAGHLLALFGGLEKYVIGYFRGDLHFPKLERDIKPPVTYVNSKDFNFMPQYLLCGGEPYYPLGGFEDAHGAYSTLDLAQAAANGFLKQEEWTNGWWSWANIGHMTDDGKLEVWHWDWNDTEGWEYTVTQLRGNDAE